MTFLLVHGTLVGPFTWSLVAAELERRGQEAIVPHVTDAGRDETCFWRRHAACVAAAAGEGGPVVVAGHSATGAILPAIVDALGRPVATLIFVDAQLPPPDGSSRAEVASPTLKGLLDELPPDGTYPRWTDDDVRDELPDPVLRRRVLAELHPKPRSYFDEPVRVPGGWERLPCAYLQFSPHYDRAATSARELGWPVIELGGGHFALLNEPVAVAEALIDLSLAAAGA